ncbi:MAG: tRNA (guanosine(18)-2'-O)-methyltransferase [Parcubacteria group bacterium ADurb.Bin326]|nr:MAG: tRNA (guanosine(18)-2'-O)-methyltransferase [Parcubacteria group bacterium ADurb.Bin326]
MRQEVYVVCDSIRSLYNVGSIFRTSDALGVKKIYLCGITGTPEQKGVLKVSLGAENSVPWEHCKNAWQLIDKLKKRGFKAVSLELTKNSKNVKLFKPKFPLVLIVGNEVDGVSQSLLKRSDAVVHIPMKGIKESLNVSVAFGIAAYEILNK